MTVRPTRLVYFLGGGMDQIYFSMRPRTRLQLVNQSMMFRGLPRVCGLIWCQTLKYSVIMLLDWRLEILKGMPQRSWSPSKPWPTRVSTLAEMSSLGSAPVVCLVLAYRALVPPAGKIPGTV